MSSPVSVEWLGCATFRVRIGEVTLFFDTFMDRIAGADPVAARSSEVRDADFVFVSHSHLDHILGADTIALNTGAPVIGSYETMRVMTGCGVPEDQRWAVSGGETVDCGAGATVRVLPSLHACLWAAREDDAGAPCLGDHGVHYQERRERTAQAVEALHTMTPEVEAYLAAEDGRASHADGGQLAYELSTPEGSILFSSSAGCWSGLFGGLRPDLAILAVAGRPNLDGEPFQGSQAQFIATEVELLEPKAVAFCHHDAWMPPIPAVDIAPVAAELRVRAPHVKIAEFAIERPAAILS
ncbi:MAG TPA: MBL fold metallo-hydrolase [Solirubrobacteraceae bacterium]|jgi:L-ascorbate metabolism protein UlaG (beta-lactamase superfamily)|nr:MBL fold metallo-hydrolase [Solirubrobacteraceae bacterium]